MLSLLKHHSPQLCSTLRRTFGNEPNAVLQLERAFAFAVERDGLLELDFIREPGVSYNLRSARIPLILIKDTQETSLLAVLTAIVATAERNSSETPKSIFDFENSSAEATSDFSFETICALAELSKQPAAEILSSYELRASNPFYRAAALTNCSAYLDRIRHLHQAPRDRLAQVLPQVLRDGEAVLVLSERLAPGFEKRISHWRASVSPRLLALVSAHI